MNYSLQLNPNGESSYHEFSPSFPSEFMPEVPAAVYFAHHDFSVEYNEETGRQDIVRGKETFFGGNGEGRKFDNWIDAIHVSLYDFYQCDPTIKEGDTITVKYKDETKVFIAKGVHILPND